MKKQTSYTINLTCDDMGEHDAIFMGELGLIVAHMMKDMGSIGYSLTLSRYRPGEQE